MPGSTVSYFTIRCIELKDSISDGYAKDSLERFLNQYVSRGVKGPVQYFCKTEAEVFAKIRVVMEFMQQDLNSVHEIFEMIQIIKLDQWCLEKDSGTDSPRLVGQINSTEHQAAQWLVRLRD